MTSNHQPPNGTGQPSGRAPAPGESAAGYEPPPPAYETTQDLPPAPSTAPPAAEPQAAGADEGGPIAAGRTAIADTAVAKVAGIAARKVHGVVALGSGTSRALGALRDAVGSSELTQGVHVEVGETQAAVDINLIASYGVPLQDVANGVRAAVYQAVQSLVGLQVIEVNVEINDVHVPEVDGTKVVPEK